LKPDNPHHFRVSQTDQHCGNCRHDEDVANTKSKVYDGYVSCRLDCWRKADELGIKVWFGKYVCDKWENEKAY